MGRLQRRCDTTYRGAGDVAPEVAAGGCESPSSRAAREKLAVRATCTKRRRADMRSAIESPIHSLDEYTLVEPGLYSASPQGRTLACSRSDSQRQENLMTLPEELAAFRTNFE